MAVEGSQVLCRKASTMSQAFALASQDRTIQERGGVPVLIIGQLYFKQPVDIGTLRTVVKDRLMNIPRFRCVVFEDDEKHFALRSVEMDDIDIRYHVCEPTKEGGGKWTDADLDHFCSQMYSREGEYKLDYQRPPLRFFTMAKDDGRTLVLPVFDHVLADGISAVAALMKILDKKDADQSPRTKRTEKPSLPLASKVRSFLGGIGSLFDPLFPADHMTVLKEPDHRRPSKDKACVKGGKIPIEDMKRIKEKFPGATLNDIMLATLTITMQRYYAELGQPLQAFRGNFPMNLRDPKEDVLQVSCGNHFIGANFAFPLEEKDPVKLVWKIKRQIDGVKCSPGPLILNKLLALTVPKQVGGGQRSELNDLLLDTYGKVTVMLSNVPGPSGKVCLCGQTLDDLMFYCFAPIGCYLGILSYDGYVNLGIVCSAKTEPQPANIAKHWIPAFRQLVDAVDAAKPGEVESARPSYTGDVIFVSILVLCLAFFLQWIFF